MNLPPIVRWLLLGSSSILVIPLALLGLGTFIPSIPYLGVIGSSWFASNPLLMTLLAVIGILLSTTAARYSSPKLWFVLSGIAMLSFIGALVVLISHLHVAANNEAEIDLISTLSTRGYGEGATPDETIPYYTRNSTEHKIDIYKPKNRKNTLAPIVVYIHGGGWVSNDRGSQAANLRWFSDRGFLAFSPDYTLATAGNPTWNIAGPDVACALQWITENASSYGGDSSKIFIYGESAGGALALTVSYALAANDSGMTCNNSAVTIRAVAANVPAVDLTSFYANDDAMLDNFSREIVEAYLGGSPQDFPDRARFASPSTYITPNAPPSLLFLSGNDHLVPVEGAHTFIEQAERAGVSIRSITFPYGAHSLSTRYYSIANQAMLQIMLHYFQQHEKS